MTRITFGSIFSSSRAFYILRKKPFHKATITFDKKCNKIMKKMIRMI